MKSISAVWLLVLAGCGPSLEGDDSLTTTESSLNNLCEDFLCGKNGATIKKFKFHELNSLGLPDEKGVRFHSASRGGVPVQFIVDGINPMAVTGGGQVFQGAALVGTILKIELADASLVDVQVTESKLTAPYDGVGRIWAYRLQYLEVAQTTSLIDVCSQATVDHGLVGTWALFSRGDRYDKTALLTHLGVAQTGSWFNVSCAGDVIAKLVRLKHVEGFESVAFHTSKTQRQAALDMFTANYCGNGVFYTSNGTPLRWLDSAGVTLPEEFGAFEAVWNGSGALCVSHPRRVKRTEIACAPRACTADEEKNWQASGAFMSTLAPLGFQAP